MLRYKADLLSVFYMVVTTGILVWHWLLPEFNVFLFIGAMLMAAPCFAMAHNHNHNNMWKSHLMNRLTDYWLTLFYGFPVYAWIPTHNLNHHRFSNKDGDYTITWRFSERNNLFTLLTYPIISAIYQQTPTSQFLKHAWKHDKPRFFFYISEYAIWIAFIGGALLLDWKKALYCIIVPSQFSVIAVLMVNYIQHVHCDEDSALNHSRNFTGIGSKLLLNAGLHTVHHEQMALHWSQLTEAHAKIADKIDPRLMERSLAWYIIRTYVLSIFVPQWRSKSMRTQHTRKPDAAREALLSEYGT